MKTNQKNKVRVALVVPHIFLHKNILPDVIFSPGRLALELASGLADFDIDVTLFTPGPVRTKVKNVTADLSYFDQELKNRGDSFIDLLKKHPFTFVTLARQVQAELIANAYKMANDGKFDIVHIYTNEEDIALPFSRLCSTPTIFTHHDPFNFLVKYKNVFPKYQDLNWVSMSLAQRRTMPTDTNWVDNISHGLDEGALSPVAHATCDYVAYLGRIIHPKGVHLAIKAVQKYNKVTESNLKLKIAGKHYADTSSDDYWQTTIEPEIGDNIEYVGFIKDIDEKNKLLGNAKALIIPSLFDEPFGMVMIEALAAGTPLIGLDSGAIPEIITPDNGILVNKSINENKTIKDLATAIADVAKIDRTTCRKDFENRFTLRRMCQGHAELYKRLAK